ncbi:MAG: exodeoxyribonuclease V beta subunit [Alteromonadaceae bacterium]|jgi:exodeoxyribonuclease V beta subunit
MHTANKTSTANINNLVAHTIPLTGKHLIEASAGTGKTFNITRIYLRLLLEKRLSVEQILVMTFTKDATEELRGRIDSFIREALANWDTFVVKDDYFIAIAQHIAADEAKILLTQALLYLDEAAIYTIHGFCKRVLSQHAFANGLSFNAAMENNCQDIVLESCQDWYRILGQQSAAQYRLVAQFWSTPTQFVNAFSKALSKHHQLDVIDEQHVEQTFLTLVQTALNSLLNNHDLLITALVDVKKGQDREVRLEELAALKTWLETLLLDNNDNTNTPAQGSVGIIETIKTVMPDKFFDGKRYARSQYKTVLLEIFEPAKQVKMAIKSLAKDINKAKAFAIVRTGIYHIRANVIDKKEQQAVLSFDDLISTLANSLANEPKGELAELLYKEYPVALVDEFQDTDPQQFNLLKAIYYHQGDAALFMIGDPKQAIYGFRGGDVFAYLSARQGCDYQWLMDTNWRSSTEMIQGYNRLFYGNTLTEDTKDVFGYDIPYLPVKASHVAKDKHFDDAKFNALQFVHFQSEQQKGAVKQSFRPIMALWCADEITRLLNSSSLQLDAQDIAILVRDGTEAAEIKLALADKGLASVYMSNRANLMKSKQTMQLLQVLKGILFVENERLYCAALASDLLGYSSKKLFDKQQDELAWQELKFTFYQLREAWQNKGFIGMALKLMHEHFSLPERDKDRVLTNLLHLFEILQAASQRHRQPQELLYWFEQQSKQDNPELEAELRLESDDNLIRIVTQHGAKGLEYPVVFVPFASRFKDPLKFGNKSVDFIEYHDDNGMLKMSLDGSMQAKKAMADEIYAETIRLLYVAITRAEQRCYLLTTSFEQCQNSPLGRTLKWQKDQNIIDSLQTIVNDNPDDISMIHIEEFIDSQAVYHQQENRLVGDVAQFSGKIERDWWLSSFSSLSRNLRHVGVSSPDRDSDIAKTPGLHADNTVDALFEGSVTGSIEGGESYNISDAESNMLRFNIAKGAHTGNLLHDILEHTNFNDADFEQTMKWPLTKYGELTPGYTESDLAQWLTQVINAPLLNIKATRIEATKSFCLADVSADKCLRESEFYFPMISANSSQLIKLLTDHRNEGLSDNTSYQAQVSLPRGQKLKGMMHGFIDLIFEHDGKYYVCDYKSSFLGEQFQAYEQPAMRANIEKNHYDLQYLIYSLALHRHLSYALDDYDAHQHFGGIYYLYLRGMTDDKQHQGRGVYHRNITFKELNQLDQMFKGVKDDV